MSRTHWLLIAGFLGGTASVMSGMNLWTDALRPSIVAGFLAQLSMVIGAIYSDKPTKE